MRLNAARFAHTGVDEPLPYMGAEAAIRPVTKRGRGVGRVIKLGRFDHGCIA